MILYLFWRIKYKIYKSHISCPSPPWTTSNESTLVVYGNKVWRTIYRPLLTTNDEYRIIRNDEQYWKTMAIGQFHFQSIRTRTRQWKLVKSQKDQILEISNVEGLLALMPTVGDERQREETTDVLLHHCNLCIIYTYVHMYIKDAAFGIKNQFSQLIKIYLNLI